MSTSDNVDVHVRMRDAARFKQEARGVKDSIDDIGDSGQRTAAKLGALAAASSRTRVNIGPFSTSMRGGATALGAMVLGVEKLTPGIVGLAEATVSVVGGGAAAGGVGLLAVGQAAGVAALGFAGLDEALGGSEDAMRRLSPQARVLFDMLQTEHERLKGIAEGGLLPGLTAGGTEAMRNAGVVRAIVQDTSRMLGNLAREGGAMLGSAEWGRDLRTVGAANVQILDSLGGAGLHLADALRHIAVEAAPLAKWLAESAETGAGLIENWAEDARRSGDMARFFDDTRRNLELIASIGGHGGRGIINLFGAADVDGTRTLANLDRIMARFERWTASGAVQEDLGKAIVAEIPDAIAAGMDAVARNLPAAAGTAATVFWEAFWDSSLEGKAVMGALAFVKFGGFKAAGGLLGRGGAAAGLTGKGGTPANPVWVAVVNGGLPGGGGRGPGGVIGAGKNFLKSPLGKGGIIGALAVAGAADAKFLWEDIQRERERTGDWTPEQRRAEAARGLQSIRPLSGQAPTRTMVPVDSQGFPTGAPIRITLHNTTTLDGEVVERHSREVLERRQARG